MCVARCVHGVVCLLHREWCLRNFKKWQPWVLVQYQFFQFSRGFPVSFYCLLPLDYFCHLLHVSRILLLSILLLNQQCFSVIFRFFRIFVCLFVCFVLCVFYFFYIRGGGENNNEPIITTHAHHEQTQTPTQTIFRHHQVFGCAMCLNCHMFLYHVTFLDHTTLLGREFAP